MSISREDMALWAKSFVDWSQSELGFYVDQYYIPEQSRWARRKAPVEWNERQRKALRHLLTIDENGRLPYDIIIWVDIGKSGKTMLGAAIAQWMGMFVGRNAEVLLAANSKEQSGVRSYRALMQSLELSPHAGQIVDSQKKDTVFTRTGNIARPIPLRATTQAGSNPVMILFDELWGYEGEAARRMMAEMKPSPTQNISLIMAVTYPGFADDDGPLNDYLESFFTANESPREGVEQVFDDLPLFVRERTAVWWNHAPYPWHTPGFLQQQRNNPGVTDSHYLRIWEARRTQREDVFLPIELWDKCLDENHHRLGRGDYNVPMVIGWDIGTKLDSMALVARGYDVATKRYPLLDHLILLPETYHVPGQIIEDGMQWILDQHRRHRVLATYYDPHQAVRAAYELEKAGVKMVEVTQNLRREQADTDYRMNIVQRILRNYRPSYDLREHVANAVGRETRSGGIRLDKRRTRNMTDGAVADSMACLAVTENTERFISAARPWTPPPKRRDPWANIYRLGRVDGRA